MLYSKFTPQRTAILALSLAMLTLTGCQTVAKRPVSTTTIQPQPTQSQPVQATQPVQTSPISQTVAPIKFAVNGKIGITTPKQAGSAFYTWGQNGQNFAIELAGALNAGQTNISYDGKTATLTNDKGTLSEANPEALLFKATGWQAPISQLPYWMMGQSAPSDSQTEKDSQNRLTKATNGDWTAEFNFANTKDTLPNRITARHPNGYKVVMTINHLN
ncbi:MULTISPECIES: lipoprotein insertase outer membrane protein LolB [unclassified Moraxella]|uniref:lipoprotein insertase outer membrane protein LolB n=1 Tax=unclassified Moraxella TaxID=2685852 RepID=UPI003AF9BED9